MKKCFFIGHRDTPETVYPSLLEAVRKHIAEYGVTQFIVGRYGAFDKLAAKAVIEAKKEYQEVSLSLLLPYHPSERVFEVPDGFDDTIYPEGMERVPHRYAIIRANRYMVDNVDYIIAYAWQPGSNAIRLIEYANRKKRFVMNLA